MSHAGRGAGEMRKIDMRGDGMSKAVRHGVHGASATINAAKD